MLGVLPLTDHQPLLRDGATWGFPEVPLVGAIRLRRATRPLRPHQHTGILEICYMAHGLQTFRVAGRDYVVHQGEIFVTQPDEQHGTGLHPRERGLLYWIQVSLRPGRTFLGHPRRAARPLWAALAGLRSGRHFAGSAHLGRLFEELLTIPPVHAPEVNDLAGLRFAATAQRLLLEVVACARKPRTQAPRSGMNDVLDHIDRHLEERLSTTALAHVAGLSTSWFKARFHAEVGLPPADYIARRRIERAQAMLQARRHSITEIAYELGFSSSQNFATVFRKYTNRTPREFRQGLS